MTVTKDITLADAENIAALKKAETALVDLKDHCAGSCYWPTCLCDGLWPTIEMLRDLIDDYGLPVRKSAAEVKP
jgi:hypothetical protein